MENEVRKCIREVKEKNIFSKDDLLKKDRITVTYNDGDFEFKIKNTLENIAQFIMFCAIYAEENGDYSFEIDFLTEPKDGDYEEYFMNTMGYMIDLCANLEYLEELKKVLIPLQLEYEDCLFNKKPVPEYKFTMFEYDSNIEHIMSSKELHE